MLTMQEKMFVEETTVLFNGTECAALTITVLQNDEASRTVSEKGGVTIANPGNWTRTTQSAGTLPDGSPAVYAGRVLIQKAPAKSVTVGKAVSADKLTMAEVRSKAHEYEVPVDDMADLIVLAQETGQSLYPVVERYKAAKKAAVSSDS